MKTPTLDKFPKEVLAKIDIQAAFIISRLIVAAERLQVFRKLQGRRMQAAAIGRALKIDKSYRDSFLNALVSLGLLNKTADTYWNTRFAEKYFVRERSIYWTRQYSKECVENYAALTALEKTLASGRICTSVKARKKASYVQKMERDREQAEDFTQMLFHYHRQDAEALAKCLDLSKHRALLDVGGGSGVMSITLARKNPRLRACVLDVATVCEIAAGNIRRAGLFGRIMTSPGNIQRRLPTGYDVIMFCDIGSLPRQLLKNAYRSLPAGGLVAAVDRYLSNDGTNPLDRLVTRFLPSSFGQETRSDMVAALRSCGFQAVRASNVYRDLWLITGTKPGGRR
jgi:predicted O-methyltransferase YrrM/predicted transcriptional regulator